MTKSIEKLAFEFWAGVGLVEEFEIWAEEELRKEEPHPDAHELFGLTKIEVCERSIRLATELDGFDPLSEQVEGWSRELLKSQGERLISGEIGPLEFCRLVTLFDAEYLEHPTKLKDQGSYNDWMGNLWNCCDWCDETWSLKNSPHLIEEVTKLIGKRT